MLQFQKQNKVVDRARVFHMAKSLCIITQQLDSLPLNFHIRWMRIRVRGWCSDTTDLMIHSWPCSLPACWTLAGYRIWQSHANTRRHCILTWGWEARDSLNYLDLCVQNQDTKPGCLLLPEEAFHWDIIALISAFPVIPWPSHWIYFMFASPH